MHCTWYYNQLKLQSLNHHYEFIASSLHDFFTLRCSGKKKKSRLCISFFFLHLALNLNSWLKSSDFLFTSDWVWWSGEMNEKKGVHLMSHSSSIASPHQCFILNYEELNTMKIVGWLNDKLCFENRKKICVKKLFVL